MYAFLFVSVGFLGISENGLGGIHGNQHEVKTTNPAMPIQPPLNRRNRLLLARAVWCCEPTSFVSQGFAAEDLEWGGSLGHLNLNFSSIDLNSEFRRHCGMRFEPFWAARNASRGMQQGKSLTASLAYFPSLPAAWKNQRGINGLGPFL